MLSKQVRMLKHLQAVEVRRVLCVSVCVCVLQAGQAAGSGIAGADADDMALVAMFGLAQARCDLFVNE
jgi:hypothetical protein